jgi:hypothetical protein
LRRLSVFLATPLAAAVCGILGASLLDLVPGRSSVLAAGAVLCLLVFVLWPWSVLPVGVVGVTAATPLLGDGHLTFIVLLHTGVLALGSVALLLRRIVSAPGDSPVRTIADAPMLAMVAIVLLGGGYGMESGNDPHKVSIAAYELGVIPAYYFLTTHTLTSPRRLRAAGILYVVCAAGLAASEFAQPGRHGGLLSLLALPPLLIAAGRVDRWKRAGVALLLAGFTADLVFASYRAMWLAAAVALVLLLARTTAPIRRAAITAGVCGTTVMLLAAASSAGAHSRSTLMGDELHQGAGYRTSEAAVGLQVLAHRPLFGAGLGQTVPHVYLPGFAVTDVGPTYHVFYVMILANVGLLGLAVTLWPILRAAKAGMATRDGYALAFSCLTCGFLAAAAFAGPSDGHWELGLLPALALTAARAERPPTCSLNPKGAR